ncbi:MAG: hypothetical protein E7118_04900 [Bacteroidales bacterium]|nr:hypothetical protein [Bacteroidales bacterium]
MENREHQILSEIRSLTDLLKLKLEEIEEKLDRLEELLETEPVYDDQSPIDIDIIEDDSVPEPVLAETEPEAEPEAAEEAFDEPEAAAEPEAVQESEDLLVAEVMLEAMPEPEDEKEEEKVTEGKTVVRQAVIDAMAARQAWRTDMPGAAVRDIRSAISLNDRVIFINHLFNEDPMMFQDMLSRINNMTSLEEVLEAVVSEYPEWDLDSEVVYRFMMAVRRKIRD